MRPRSRCASGLAAAARLRIRDAACQAIEMLESRRLMCADHFLAAASSSSLARAYDPNNPNSNDIRVVVTTNGFEPAPDTIVAAGMLVPIPPGKFHSPKL